MRATVRLKFSSTERSLVLAGMLRELACLHLQPRDATRRCACAPLTFLLSLLPLTVAQC